MLSVGTRERLQLVALDTDTHLDEFSADVQKGLSASPKRLSCRFLYDERGSLLFEKICDLPEYYITRTEYSILSRCADEITGLFPEWISLVELGSGSATKTRILIDAFLCRHDALRYVPVDISSTILEESSLALLEDYPRLQVHAVAAEYEQGLERLKALNDRAKLILWLGSNVGNLGREEAAVFLRRVGASMQPRDRLLVGIDLRKDRAVLERAYDDASRVTAAFNLNLLARVNRELGGHFNLKTFRHRATYNAEEGRVEIYLDSLRCQHVAVDRLRMNVPFREGESIHTENSYKYSPEEIEALAHGGGLRVDRQWYDEDRNFRRHPPGAVKADMENGWEYALLEAAYRSGGRCL